MKTMFKGILVVTASCLLAGCGGSAFNSNGTGGTGNASGSGTVSLGSGNGSAFQAGTLGITSTSLAAGGSTTVTAALQNSNGTPYAASTTITFTSPCFQDGLAVFTVAGTTNNTATTSTGQASVTYSAQGCSGADAITATASVNGVNLTATGTVTVAASTIGSVQFVSATPTTISLKGVGGTETSTVVFKVVGSTGGPVPNASVTFKLSSTAGGLSLSPTTAITGINGETQTVVESGTVATPVKVTATVQVSGGSLISAQSNNLYVSTGIPTENGFSLGVSAHSVEGFNTVGVPDTLTVQLADNFGNPVPDGTAVSFVTNGGSIQPDCNTASNSTQGGVCSVTWSSGDPVPGVDSNGPFVLGHAEILAYAIGEESFTDVNANGIFENNDQFSIYHPGTTGADNFYYGPKQDDIGDVYLDQNESGAYQQGDRFFDLNNSSVRLPPNGEYYGAGCKGTPTVPCGGQAIYVGRQTCIVMATANVNITGPTSITSPGTYNFYVMDLNGNVPATGTTVTITGTLTNATATFPSGTSSVVEPDIVNACSLTNGYEVSVAVLFQGTPPSGSFTITATSPVSKVISPGITVTVQ